MEAKTTKKNSTKSTKKEKKTVSSQSYDGAILVTIKRKEKQK